MNLKIIFFLIFLIVGMIAYVETRPSLGAAFFVKYKSDKRRGVKNLSYKSEFKVNN